MAGATVSTLNNLARRHHILGYHISTMKLGDAKGVRLGAPRGEECLSLWVEVLAVIVALAEVHGLLSSHIEPQRIHMAPIRPQ